MIHNPLQNIYKQQDHQQLQYCWICFWQCLSYEPAHHHRKTSQLIIKSLRGSLLEFHKSKTLKLNLTLTKGFHTEKNLCNNDHYKTRHFLFSSLPHRVPLLHKWLLLLLFHELACNLWANLTNLREISAKTVPICIKWKFIDNSLLKLKHSSQDYYLSKIAAENGLLQYAKYNSDRKTASY